MITSYILSGVVPITVFIALLCACILIGHLLEGWRWASESIASLLLGLCAGLVTLLVTGWKSSRILSFNEELFFIYLLPPIIFNAGFQVKKKQFFRNFITILLFGVVGTLIAFCIIAVGSYFLFKEIGITSVKIKEYLALGAIFAATDSVCTLQVLNQEETPLLYSLVFGEGVTNDATSIVLFNAVQSLNLSNVNTVTAFKLFGTFLYLFVTSTLLGIAVGLISAYVIKKLYIGRHSTHREVAIMLLLAYLSYMVSEISYLKLFVDICRTPVLGRLGKALLPLHDSYFLKFCAFLLSLSGILTIFFCGIMMSHYTWHNTTERSKITTRHAFATMSFISETFIFLYVGMDALDIDKWKMYDASVGTRVAISGLLFVLVMVGRAIFVFTFSNIVNCTRRGSSTKIDLRNQSVIWWSGLMRGAVTLALAYEFSSSSSVEEGAFIVTTTIIVVLFSTVVCGSMTKPLMDLVLGHNLRTDDSNISGLEDMHFMFLENCRSNSTNNHENRRSSLGMLVMYPTTTIHYLWRKFDDRFMRPVFGGRGFVPVAAEHTASEDEV